MVGDRNYWSPTTTAEWHVYQVALLAPYRSAKRDPHPRWSARLSRVRYRINALGSPRFVVIRRVRKDDGFMPLSSPKSDKTIGVGAIRGETSDDGGNTQLQTIEQN